MTACSGDPDFTTVDGKSHAFDDFNGQYLLVPIWAEWCKPCIDEIPIWNTLSLDSEYTWTLMAANFDQVDMSELAALKSKYKIQYQLMQTEIWPKALPRAEILPAFMIRDPKGNWLEPHYGPLSADQIQTILDTIRKSQ